MFSDFLCSVCEGECVAGNISTHTLTSSSRLLNDNTFFYVDFLSMFVPAVAIVSLLCVILCWGYMSQTVATKSSYHLKYPGHEIRWMATVILILIHTFMAAERFISDVQDASNQSRWHVYAPDLVAMVMNVVTLYVGTRMEKQHRLSFALALAVTWIASGFVQFLRLWTVLCLEKEFLQTLRMDGLLVSFLLYAVLAYVDLRNYFHKGSKGQECDESYRRKMQIRLEEINVKFKEDYCILPEKIFIWWLFPLLKEARKRTLTSDDVGSIAARSRTLRVHLRMRDDFGKFKQKEAGETNRSPPLWRVALIQCYRTIIISGIMKLLADALTFVQPIGIKKIILYATNGDVTDNQLAAQSNATKSTYFISVDEYFQNAYVLVIVMFVAQLAQSILSSWPAYINRIQCSHVVSGIQTLIFEKMLFLPKYVIDDGTLTIGEIANHLTVDLANLGNLAVNIHNVWSVPLKLMISIFLLYGELGASCLPGMVLAVLFLPVQYQFSRIVAHFKRKKLKFSDKRLKRFGEMLSAIRFLKMCGCEESFCKSIAEIRRNECWQLLMFLTGNFIESVTATMMPYFVCIITFILYTWYTGLPLTSDKAFFTITIIQNLSSPLLSFSRSLTHTLSCIVSFKRLEIFFTAPVISGQRYLRHKTDLADKDDEKEVDNFERIGQHLFPKIEKCVIEDYDKDTSDTTTGKKISIQIKDATFSWNRDGDSIALSDINLMIPKGNLTMVIGAVASGKTALLSAILGEMETTRGNIRFSCKYPKIAFSAQIPWILNGSIEYNITLGRIFNYERYRRIIKATALEHDLRLLPAGDQTEIGEQGIRLSGGQNHRLSLARAMYSDCDVILLDNPLSSLDSEVASFVLKHGIIDVLKKEGKTIVITTNQMKFISQADQIVLIADGKVTRVGKPDEFLDTDSDLCTSWKDVNRELDTPHKSQKNNKKFKRSQHNVGHYHHCKHHHVEDDHVTLKKHTPMKHGHKDNEKAKLIEKEKHIRGRVTWDVYWIYFKHFGSSILVSIFICLVCVIIFNALFNFCLSVWTSSSDGGGVSILQEERSTQYYITVYTILFLCVTFTKYVTEAFLTYGCWSSACKLHDKMIYNLIRAPLRFFDTTPKGRIFNRFSRDLSILEEMLTKVWSLFFRVVVFLCVVFLTNVVISPPLILLFIVYIIIYCGVYVYFIDASRDLTRLQNKSMSPILSLAAEALHGLSSARAYRREKDAYFKFLDKVDNYLLVTKFTIVTIQWVVLNLLLLSCASFLVIAFLAVLGSYRFQLSPSLVGLAIASALEMSSIISSSVISFAHLESSMTSVERVKTYIDVKTENQNGCKPPKDWPSKGKVLVENVTIKYAEHLDPVLKDVSFEILGGQKIGVCGRTGSGKSTLTMSLLRLLIQTKGRITIDGIDIETVPLQTLRSRISVVPQEPILFNGTIRENIDFDRRLADADIWDILEKVQLKDKIARLHTGLDSFISAGGSNFSLGEKQLLCLARTIVRGSTIIVLDEPTAFIDTNTSYQLQRFMKDVFHDKTVITVAHRVTTILNSDMIMVLQDGHIVEYDSPTNLLLKEGSIFASFVRESSETSKTDGV
ncbi:ATP-binding cassette sub-family C member 8-like [Apostichopus japonicus]|uniref:ATP-binding cassette sub-family C member 8-like n=1 Tax=Stichopus japonicus TaxID=307972 RepID=UPI003AB4458C